MKELTEHDKQLIIDSTPASDLVLFCPGLQGSGGSLRDRSANANHGTISGATWKRLPSGVRYLNFDGSGDYVTFAGAALRITNCSYHLWLKHTADVNNVGLFGWNGNLSNEGVHVVALTGPKFRFHTQTSVGQKALLESAAHALNTWLCYDFEYDGATMKIYKNAVSMGSSTAASGNLLYPNGAASQLLAAYYNETVDITGGISLFTVNSAAQGLTEITRRYNRERRLLGV